MVEAVGSKNTDRRPNRINTKGKSDSYIPPSPWSKHITKGFTLKTLGLELQSQSITLTLRVVVDDIGPFENYQRKTMSSYMTSNNIA